MKRWMVRQPAVGAVLVLALTGGVAGSVGCPGEASAAPAAASRAGTVHVATLPAVGAVLVDGAGHAVYAFSPDKQRRATCDGSCASVWPPLLSGGKPLAGSGVRSALLGTVKDPDGKTQVTYNRWPLYLYAGDSAAGQAHGQGITSFGGKWSTIGSSGQVFHATPSSTSTSVTSGGGGYGY